MADPEPPRAQIDALFVRALALPVPERAPFLDSACREAPHLRVPVEELLAFAFDAATRDPCSDAVGALWETLGAELADGPSPPERVGPWRVLRELGRGGMGTVYLATRGQPGAEEKAALKLLRAGLVSDDAVHRFEQERRLLARLEHPGIARALDGGLASGDLPYFAMEYVDGLPLLRYCDENRLDVGARLAILGQVCRAVHHAHLHLVVHRDLKPSNILVAGDGQVKLLDFGIARVLDGGAGGTDAATRTLARLLTPEYASPEQVMGEPVEAASDVYQLGLLLYELLCGVRAQRTDGADPASWKATVCDQRPLPPSRVATAPPDAEARAHARATTSAALALTLRAALDDVVLTALRKEPERRYASAERLAEDLDLCQEGRRPRARPDTLGYRARVFVRRHPAPVGAAALVAVLGVGYAVSVTRTARALALERDRARVEAVKAERVKDFVVGLFRAADPYQARGDALTASDLLDAGARQARERLRAEPEVLAELLGVLGGVLSERAAYDKAEPLLAEAVELRRSLASGDDPALARAIHDLAVVRMERGALDDAERLAYEALAMRLRLFGPLHAQTADSRARVGMVLGLKGEYARAEATQREVLAVRRALPADESALADTWDNLGVQQSKQGREAEAEAAHREALRLRRAVLAPEHPSISESLNNLAVTLRRSGRAEEAEPLLREALALRRLALGARHPRVANVLNNLGELQRALGRSGEAVASQREALDIRREVFGAQHSNVALSLVNLGAALRDGGRLQEAEPPLREGYAMFKATLPAGHPSIGRAALGLGRLLTATGRPREAELLLVEAVASAGDGPGTAAAEAWLGLGLCRAAQGRQVEARRLLSAAPRLLAEHQGDVFLVTEAARTLADLSSDGVR